MITARPRNGNNSQARLKREAVESLWWKIVAGIGTAIGIFTAGFIVATSVYDFKSRLEKVENRVNLIAVAPAVVRRDAFTPGTPEKDYSQPIANPLIETCADLYNRVAAAVEKKDYKTQSNLNGYLRELGCPEALKGTSK